MRKCILLVLLLLTVKVLYAGIIDSFDSVSGWSTNTDSGSALTLSQDTGYSGNSANMIYNFGTGQWSEISKDFSSLDLSQGDAIKFYYKGSGSGNLQVQLVDADGSVFVKTINNIAAQTDWKELALTFSGTYPDFQYSWGGDSSLDKSKISKIIFGVTSNGSAYGSLDIDNIRLFLSDPLYKTLDNFDDLDSVNNFGGNSGVFTTGASSGTCSGVYVSTVVFSGTGALELKYNVSGNGLYSGYWTNLQNMDFSNVSYLSFRVKGMTGGEKFQAQLRGSTIKVRISSYTTVTTDWQEVKIPLADFTGFISTGSAGSSPEQDQLCFVFENSNGPSSGTVYIDEVVFLKSATAGSLIASIDAMDDAPTSLSNWASYGITNAVNGTLRSVSGRTGSDTDLAIEIPYSFTIAGQWAVMERKSSPLLAQDSAFRFKYKGSGSKDNIEFKVADQNNNVFRKMLPQAADTNNIWQTVDIPYTELTYFSGDEQKLDLKNIKVIRIAVSKSAVSQNAGNLAVDELESISYTQQQNLSGKLLESFSLQNNPFSPNDDGIKDKARFIFKVKISSRVKLEIFTLKGERIYNLEKEILADGNEHLIEWDGKDKENKLVSNGPYLFTFITEGYDGQQDKISNVMMVIK